MWRAPLARQISKRSRTEKSSHPARHFCARRSGGVIATGGWSSLWNHQGDSVRWKVAIEVFFGSWISTRREKGRARRRGADVLSTRWNKSVAQLVTCAVIKRCVSFERPATPSGWNNSVTCLVGKFQLLMRSSLFSVCIWYNDGMRCILIISKFVVVLQVMTFTYSKVV